MRRSLPSTASSTRASYTYGILTLLLARRRQNFCVRRGHLGPRCRQFLERERPMLGLPVGHCLSSYPPPQLTLRALATSRDSGTPSSRAAEPKASTSSSGRVTVTFFTAIQPPSSCMAVDQEVA